MFDLFYSKHRAPTPSNGTYRPTTLSERVWYKNNEPSKDCAWVSSFSPRCDALGWDGTFAYENCESCGGTSPPADQPVVPTYAPTPELDSSSCPILALITDEVDCPLNVTSLSACEDVDSLETGGYCEGGGRCSNGTSETTCNWTSPVYMVMSLSSDLPLSPTPLVEDEWYVFGSPENDCDWVSLDTDRCSVVGFDGRAASDACEVCGGSTSPASTPSIAPTADVTISPTAHGLAVSIALRFDNDILGGSPEEYQVDSGINSAISTAVSEALPTMVVSPSRVQSVDWSSNSTSRRRRLNESPANVVKSVVQFEVSEPLASSLGDNIDQVVAQELSDASSSGVMRDALSGTSEPQLADAFLADDTAENAFADTSVIEEDGLFPTKSPTTRNTQLQDEAPTLAPVATAPIPTNSPVRQRGGSSSSKKSDDGSLDSGALIALIVLVIVACILVCCVIYYLVNKKQDERRDSYDQYGVTHKSPLDSEAWNVQEQDNEEVHLAVPRDEEEDGRNWPEDHHHSGVEMTNSSYYRGQSSEYLDDDDDDNYYHDADPPATKEAYSSSQDPAYGGGGSSYYSEDKMDEDYDDDEMDVEADLDEGNEYVSSHRNMI